MAQTNRPPSLPQEIIRKKRDGLALAVSDIDDFIAGVTDGRVTEGQIAAFCMTVLWRGLGLGERVALTRAMTHSGRIMEWRKHGIAGPIVDKHSTGGVGDKVSLMLAPIVAACGVYVPMISGRGLGHTGGTLDKLQAIAGYNALPDESLFADVLRKVGCAIIGATDDLAPADKRIYAVRDVTATVESLDLITASILSKKLAAGLQGLVMDVKFGSGAFMSDYAKAKALAESIVTVAQGAGLAATAYLTDMNQVLGFDAGNAIEVREAISFLTNPKASDGRLLDITLTMAAEMLVLAKLAPDATNGRRLAEDALRSGCAAEKFAAMVKALGGPADLLERVDAHLPLAKARLDVRAEQSGYVGAIDVRAMGLAIVALGGGRTRPQDPIDPSVGLGSVAPLGAKAGPNERPLATIYARDQESAERAAEAVRRAISIAPAPPEVSPIIAERID